MIPSNLISCPKSRSIFLHGSPNYWISKPIIYLYSWPITCKHRPPYTCFLYIISCLSISIAHLIISPPWVYVLPLRLDSEHHPPTHPPNESISATRPSLPIISVSGRDDLSVRLNNSQEEARSCISWNIFFLSQNICITFTISDFKIVTNLKCKNFEFILKQIYVNNFDFQFPESILPDFEY